MLERLLKTLSPWQQGHDTSHQEVSCPWNCFNEWKQNVPCNMQLIYFFCSDLSFFLQIFKSLSISCESPDLPRGAVIRPKHSMKTVTDYVSDLTYDMKNLLETTSPEISATGAHIYVKVPEGNIKQLNTVPLFSYIFLFPVSVCYRGCAATCAKDQGRVIAL